MVAHPPSSTILRASLPVTSSGQALPRHMEVPAYRCFLPDLTGFTALAAQDQTINAAHRPTASGTALEREFSPAIADCGYRAPLAPRLARPQPSLPAGTSGGKRAAAVAAARLPPTGSAAPSGHRAGFQTRPLGATLEGSDRRRTRELSPMKRLVLGVAAAALVLGAAVVGVAQMRPPAAAPTSASPQQFSGERAMDLVRVIATEPHPIGSARQTVVRDFILDQLTRLRLDPRVEGATVVAPENARVAGTVHDIVGRLPGTDPTKAVLLVAHYDSVPTTGGAADDASGVAAVLETARALRAGAPLRNDVLFLFTDGEERGLLGAQAFVRAPSAGDVGLVMNLDNPGSGGPSLLAETTPGDLWLVRQFAAVSTNPIASSLVNEVSRRRWIESDFTPFQAAGHAGFDFAFFAGFARNHTARDDPAHLDVRSLQHQGSSALALARRFGGLDLRDVHRGEGDAVFFDPVGAWLVVYPMRAVPFIVLACVALLGGVVVLGVRRRRLTAGGVARGLGLIALTLVATVGLVSLVWVMLRSAYDAQGLPDVGSASDGLHELGLVCLAAAVAMAVFAIALKSAKVAEMAVAGHVVWLAFAVATAVWAPGASYLFAWPLMASLIALLVVVTAPRRPAHLDTRLRRRRPGRSARHPPAQRGDLSLLHDGGVAAAWAGDRRLAPSRPPAGAARAGLSRDPSARARAPSHRRPGHARRRRRDGHLDRAHPRENSVFYELQAGSGQSRWLSLDDQADLWSSQFLSAAPRRSANVAYFPRVGKADYLFATAPRLALPGPRLRVLSDVVAEGKRTLVMRVTSPRRAPVLSMMAESVVGRLAAKVDGVALGSANTHLLDGTSVRWAADYYALPREGIVLTLSYDEPQRALRLRLMDCSYGLPAAFASYYRARPDSMIPGDIGDATLVATTYELPSPVAPANPPASATPGGEPSPSPSPRGSPSPSASVFRRPRRPPQGSGCGRAQ